LVDTGKCLSLIGELNILHKLRNYKFTFKGISELYKIPIMEVINCFDRHVKINRHELTKVICLDEFYARHLTKTKYCFVIFDPFSNTILDIIDARLKSTLSDYFHSISRDERKNVYYVNIDMWQTYKDISLQYFPNATICIDSFHVIEHLNKSLDKIRLKIQKCFKDKNDPRKISWYWLLKTFKYYLLSNMDNITYFRKPKSHYSHLWSKWDVLEAILSTSDGLREAYNLKEEYREFNACGTYEEAVEKIPYFIQKFKGNRYEEFREFGQLLENWMPEIINSFIIVDGKRMSNGPMESANSRIKTMIHDGFGYSNFSRFRNKVMYSLNKNEPMKF
jgi:transposase